MNKTTATTERSIFRKIMNYFIFFFIGLSVLLLLIFGFTQTKTFRSLLKEQVVLIVNDALYAKLSLGDIQGSILTSIKLYDVNLSMETDTLVSVEKLALKFNPLQLLFNRIKVSNIELVNPKIKMFQDSLGIWNIEKIAKPTEEDTTTSTFPYVIEVANLELLNADITRKSFENLNQDEKVEFFNADNIHFDNLNLFANALVDIKNNEYFLELKNFKFNSNLKYFNLEEFNGSFGITDKTVRINNLHFASDSSDVKILATIDSINLFDDFSMKKLENSPISFNLIAESFDFKDLNTFIESFDLLKGKIDLDFRVSGKIGNFYVNNFVLGYRKSKLDIKGVIKNLDQPSNLYFDLNMKNSNLVENDICILMPGLDMPRYPELELSKLDIKYQGGIQKFKAVLNSGINNGNIMLDTDLDFSGVNFRYDVKLQTKDLNLYPVLSSNTNLNINSKINGVGTDLAGLTAKIELDARNSSYEKYSIDSLKLDLNANNKNIQAEMEGRLNNALAKLNGNLDLTNENEPKYFLKGEVSELDLSQFNPDSLAYSNLNFSFDVNAKSFDVDSLIGAINFKIDDSEFDDKSIESSSFRIFTERNQKERKITLKSDILDFEIKGAFSLKDAINILAYESDTIIELIKEKAKELNPILDKEEKIIEIKNEKVLPDFIKKNLKFDFDFTFNNFETISSILDFDKLDIAGSGKGYVYNDSTNFSINTDLQIDYFINVIKEQMIYLSGIKTNFKLSRDNQKVAFDNLFGSISLTNKRLYAGSEVKNLTADLIFNQSKLIFSASAGINNMIDSEIDGVLLMNPGTQTLKIENIWVKYLDEEWSNNSDLLVDFTPEFVKVKDFKIYNDKTEISFAGSIFTDSKLDAVFGINNIGGKLFSHYAQGIVDPKIKLDIDFNTEVKGTLEDPIIKSKLTATEIFYDKLNLGNLICNLDYNQSTVVFDLRFLDKELNYDSPDLLFTGNLPIYLGTKSVESRLINDRELAIDLFSEKFNLSTFENLLPIIGIRDGIVQSKVKIGGTFEDVKYSGVFKVIDGLFRLKNNNLDYAANMELNFNKQQIDIEKFELKNSGGVKNSGIMSGKGTIFFDDFNLKKVTAKINGDLSVLSFGSRNVLPIFYGDLYIGSIGEWDFVYENEKAVFTGAVALNETNLVFSPQQNTYSQVNSNYNYQFVLDSSKIDLEEINFNRFMNAKNGNTGWGIEKSSGSVFNYLVKVSTLQNAKLVFVLSEATNQKLTVEAVGDINYENKNGETRAQGEFKLLAGSKLEFIKTFDATGSIRFESDVTNPYLNVVATYRANHVTTQGTEEEVMVKMVLEGTVDELGKNLASNPDNISVYVGVKNIENGTPDKQLGAADAFSFIVIGKFVKDLTAIDQTLLASQADMLLGSVLSSVASSVFGDAINNIQLSQSMGYTKFSVSGKVSNFKYSIGGTTDIFKDVSAANLKIEYLFSPDFSIRVERKEPVVQNFGSENKINEMGLKYRFQF